VLVVSATMNLDFAFRGYVPHTPDNQPELFYADLPLPRRLIGIAVIRGMWILARQIITRSRTQR
jgi:hypothetical protein